ncbi:hypothetical protein [Micromonospora sp. CB01531]|uniref:hypothetical protein n=1 Tax=Micromonospora sp. CB01531 TaxID=1718947 RepID=UPI0011610899|nr:hypothetical protein [Micromonospora sp. CB01531]
MNVTQTPAGTRPSVSGLSAGDRERLPARLSPAVRMGRSTVDAPVAAARQAETGAAGRAPGISHEQAT